MMKEGRNMAESKELQVKDKQEMTTPAEYTKPSIFLLNESESFAVVKPFNKFHQP